MKQVKECLPKQKEKLKKQNPTWEVENTGGTCFTLSKNLPTLTGDIAGVWIRAEGVVLRHLLNEEGFTEETIQELMEKSISLNE